MKLKMILSLFLCFLLAFSPALAQTESQVMQEVLTKAKTILDIPEEYTEFSYFSETDADGTVYWNFNWSGEKQGNMEATLSADGHLVKYYSWVYTESYDDSLANYTQTEAKEIARAFIERVNPDLYSRLREIIRPEENLNSRTAQFLFREFIGEIPVYANTLSVTVDRYHGTVRNYQGAKQTQTLLSSDVKLTEEEAKTAYLNVIDIGLEYRLYYDYQKKDYTVFPVYFLKNTSGKAVDAVTGEVLEPYFPESYLYRYTTNGAMADAVMKEEAAAGVQFTPEELEALSDVAEVYSQEEILGIAFKKIPSLKNYALHTSSLQRDYRDETKLFWQLRLKHDTEGYANVTLNAKTAQLQSFSVPDVPFENKNFTEEKAKKIAEEFLLKEASDVFSDTRYTKEEYRYVPLKAEEKLPGYYWITYQRMENGILVNGNRLSVRVDAKNGQVGAFERSWTDGLSFPDVSDCMKKETILDIMDDKMEFSLTYIPTKEGHKTAYTFLNGDSRMFDPFTGAVLNYDGTIREVKVTPEYFDIKGHWAEEMILTLLDNGYYFPEQAFRPDDGVTKKEFLTFIKMIGSDTDEQINELISRIEGTEIADCHAPLTKEASAAYLIYRMGYQKVAELDHIFVYPFHDENELNPKWKGDISLAAGLGIFRGDKDGNFYPAKELSRAEAASILYHFLKIKP